MSRYPLTDYIETNKALFDAAEVLLKTITGLNVYKYAGSSVENLFRELPSIILPAAVLAYDRSTYYDDRQRRRVYFHILCVVRAPKNAWTEGMEPVSAIATSVMAKLDGVLLAGNAFCTAYTDDVLDLGPSISVIDVMFTVRDH